MNTPVRAQTYLVDLREEEIGQRSTENAQGAGHEERILTGADWVGSIVLEDREDIGAHESSDLADRRSVRVVLATDGGCARLGRTQADVITGSDFTEREEDTNWVT